jgi:hypothetical protein
MAAAGTKKSPDLSRGFKYVQGYNLERAQTALSLSPNGNPANAS